RKTGAVNAMPRESTGNRDGGTKRTGNNRAVTGRSQAPTSVRALHAPRVGGHFLSAPSERKFGDAESWKILVTRVKKIPLTCSQAASHRCNRRRAGGDRPGSARRRRPRP